MLDGKLTYKDKEYFYGVERVRDFPTRGKTSKVFFIKRKSGYKYLTRDILIFRKDLRDMIEEYFFDDMEEFVKKKIDEYVLKSRRRNLKILKHNEK